jgi:ketosteroid isomerase-like protein
MSEETVAQVRNAYATFNRRDWEAFRRLMDRDVTVESRLMQMEMRDGRCTWWRNCSTESEALEAIAERSASG